MIDFTPADVFLVLTPATLISCAIAGLALGVFLLRVHPMMTRAETLVLFIAGLAFCVFVATARYADAVHDPSIQWEKWLGTTILWVEYVAFAVLFIWGYRRWRTGK